MLPCWNPLEHVWCVLKRKNNKAAQARKDVQNPDTGIFQAKEEQKQRIEKKKKHLNLRNIR